MKKVVKIYEAEYPWLTRLRGFLLLGFLLLLLPVIVAVALEEQMEYINLFFLIVMFGGLLATLAVALFLNQRYHTLFAANRYLLIEDETGVLWRLNKIILNFNEYYNPLGVGMVSSKGRNCVGNDIFFKGTITRDTLKNILNNISPPCSSSKKRKLSKNIIELSKLRIYRETSLVWKVAYQDAAGKQARLIVPKAYPKFLPEKVGINTTDERTKFSFPIDLLVAPAIIDAIWILFLFIASK